MGYLFREDDPDYQGPDIDTPVDQPTGKDGYLFPEDAPGYQPPVQQPRFQHKPQESPQLFPPGQDHVAREVLGLKSKPYQRSEILPESHFGILGDLGSGLAAGVLQTGEMALRAARAFDAPGGIDIVRDATTAGIETIAGWEEEYPRVFKPSEVTGDSWFRNAVYGGMRGIVPSMAFGGLGAVAGTLVGSPLVGFALGAGGVFALSEYDQFMEDAENSGISRDDAFPYAFSSALVEGLGEGIANYLGGKLLGIKGLAIEPFKTTVKRMMKISAGTMAKGMLKQLPVEVGTEMAQGGSQTFLRNLAGMDAGDPWKAAVESIGPAIVMTLAFGAAGAGKQSIQLRNARKVLEDGDANPVARKNAADFVTFHLNKVDKDLAELWKFNTSQYIEAGYGIPIDRKTSEYLAWGEHSNYSPEMAEGLLENKDIKLLPEGQGFVLVGEAYDPDEKADYDQYSPEMAEQLIRAKETKLLPDGQGFTMAGDATVYSPQLAKKLKAEKEKKLLEAPDRRAEAPAAPTVIPIPPVEAAARGVEAAIEIGRPEDIAQAQRRLERRAEPVVADKTLSLVRSVLAATPEATIGEVYRSVKERNPEASRQEVAKLVRQETVTEIPTTQRALTIALKDLGQDEFNHQYNPLNVEAKMVKELTDRGISREQAKTDIRPAIEKYTANYRAVNEKALAKRAKEKEAAEGVKKAAEAVKKKKAEPKPKKKKLEAKPKKKPALVQKKREAKPTKFKAPVSEAVAAMGKEPKLKPTRKKTKAVLDKKETKKVIEKADAKREEEITPSDIRIGVEVTTPDGKGTILTSPQPKQWAVRMNEGWAKGDTLIFAEGELTPEGKLKAKPKVKAKFAKRPQLVAKKVDEVVDEELTSIAYNLERDGKVVGEVQLELDGKTGEAWVDWFQARGADIQLLEMRRLIKQFKKAYPQTKRFVGFRKYDTGRDRPGKVDVKAKLQTKLTRVVEKVLSLTKANNGATVNYLTGKDMSGTNNYAVGVFPGETVKVDDVLTEDILSKWITKNEATLLHKDFNIGTWIDNDGVTHLDISVAEKELWKAIALAKDFGQEAIWDLEKKEELYTKSDVKGKAKSFEEVVARMAELDSDTPITIVRYMKNKANPSYTDVGAIDPENPTHRTALPGKEAARLKGDSKVPLRVHYYIEGGQVEPHVAKLPYKYTTTIPRSKLYDTVTDPLNLNEKATPKGQVRANPNVAERLMRDAGYWGYRSPGGAFPSTVVIFEQLPVYEVKKTGVKARSSESIAKQAAAEREQDFVAIIRRAMPTATRITPVQGYIGGYNVPQNDAFHVYLPNGAHIQVKFNAMPEEIQAADFQATYERDISREIPVAVWAPGPNVTITGEGTIWLAGFGDLQYDVPHEVWHAAKDIVLSPEEDGQLKKDYPGPKDMTPAEREDTQYEREAEAYEKWLKVQDSNVIFDKVRAFFQRIAETFGIDKGKSYKIFRAVESGRAWERPLGKVSSKGRLYDSIRSLMKELPKYKGDKKPSEDILDNRDHWQSVGAVLYIEGLSGRAWTLEMTEHLKRHYRIDKIPQSTLRTLREDSQHIFEKRAGETLSGKLPTMEALMEMEQRGAKEGGIVWYDETDGISMITVDSNGDLIARSARSELEEYFGEDAEFMAGLIAHLSSGLQVPVNMTKAIEVYIAHKLGLRFKGTYQVSKEKIDEFLESRETSGPKRLPFFQALMGDADAVVIDRWMARVLDFRSKSKAGDWVTSVGASDMQRELLIEWVKRGALRLGISNRAYQAMIWAGKKAIDEETSGRPTGSLAPLADVIEQKVKLKGILAKDIPGGKEDEYFILKGMDRWAIHKNSFMPLADLELFPDLPKRKKPSKLVVPKKPVDTITAAERAELEKQQGRFFAKMTDSTIVEDSLDDIFGGKEKGVLQKMKDGIKRMKAWRTLILDEFHPILEHLGEKTYKLHRMLNGVHASIEAFMRHGKLRLDEDGNIVADGRHRGFAVWAKKHGKDAVNVLRWAAAQRSEQLERDNPEWLQNEEFLTEAKRERIYREIGEAPEGGGTWGELHAEFDEFHQSVLDIAEKAGLIDSVVREDWRDLIYVPFYRVFEDNVTREEFLANPRRAKDIAAGMKPIKGSKRKIGEPIENVIANWGYMIQESMRNQARAEAYVNAKLMNEISDLMRDIDYNEIKHTIVNDKGVISYETERGDDMVLSFLENGKRKYFAVHDADLYYALTTMNAQHFGPLFNTFFGGPKRLLTYGATFGPAFRVANAVRDTLHTWMITPGFSFTPFLDTFKGFISSMREDEHYVAALAAGGLHGGSYVHAEDPTSMSKFTKRLLGKEKDSIILDTGSKVLEFWDRLGAASENAARVQLHRNLIERGETGFEAAYQARDLLDFALKGQATIVLALIRTIPFLGARTQGNYRLARAAFDPKTRVSMWIKGGILAAASLALWSAFKDDDRYKELEDYDKWTYYHFWIGDQHYRMPKPFEVGAIFSSMFESAANTMTDNEEIEFMSRFFKHTFTETFAVGVPQTIKPLAELWANKSFFTGRPIEGRAMKLLEPGERAEPWTSETLQLLGKGLNISPKKMEALMRGYLATISAFILGGTDQVARWVGDFPERPTYRADDYPLIGRFWRQGPARNTKYATRLYESMEESDRLVQTVKHYMIEGNMEKAEKLADSNLGLFSANKMLNRIRKKMTQLRRVMKDVERDRKLSRDEKRRELDELTVLRNSLMKEVYDVLAEEIK